MNSVTGSVTGITNRMTSSYEIAILEVAKKLVLLEYDKVISRDIDYDYEYNKISGYKDCLFVAYNKHRDDIMKDIDKMKSLLYKNKNLFFDDKGYLDGYLLTIITISSLM